MARDRQRAKQRRARRRETVPSDATEPRSEAPAQVDRDDEGTGATPDALLHSSAAIDEIEAVEAISAAAAAEPEEFSDEGADDESDAGGRKAGRGAGGDGGGSGGSGGGSGGRSPSGSGGGAARSRPSTKSGPLPFRFIAFLRASWSELQRVQWPDRPQVISATGVVLLFVIIAGAFLGIADWVAQQIVNQIV
jgi:preprotein translocase subunit SecE